MSGRRTVTVETGDYGRVTVPEPEWCTGDHPSVDHRSDIAHFGTESGVPLRGYELLAVGLAAYPFAERAARRPYLTVDTGGEYTPFHTGADLIEFTNKVAAHLDRLRAAAAELDALLASEKGAGR